jgi:hypothetical protein
VAHDATNDQQFLSDAEACPGERDGSVGIRGSGVDIVVACPHVDQRTIRCTDTCHDVAVDDELDGSRGGATGSFIASDELDTIEITTVTPMRAQPVHGTFYGCFDP